MSERSESGCRIFVTDEKNSFASSTDMSSTSLKFFPFHVTSSVSRSKRFPSHTLH